MRYILICFSAIALCLGSSGWSRAAEPAAATSYVPSDAAVVTVARVKKIMDSKLLEPVLKEATVAELLKQAPFDPRKINEFIVVGLRSTPEQKPSGPVLSPLAAMFRSAMIVRFTEPTDAKELLTKLAPIADPKFEPRTHQGKTYFFSPPDLFFAQSDDKTMIVAPLEECIKDMLSGTGGKGPLADKLRAAGSGDDVTVVVLVEPLRELITKARAGIPPGAATDMPILAELAALPEQLKSAVLTLNLSSETLAKAVLECTGAESGPKVKDTLQKALDTVKPLAGMAVLAARSSSDTPQAAKDAMDVGLRLLDGIKLAASGDQVTVTVAKPKGLEKLVETLLSLRAAGTSRPGQRISPPGAPQPK